MKQTILCSAIWFDDNKKHNYQPKNISTGFVVCGHRHVNILHTVHAMLSTKLYIDLKNKLSAKNITQGFISNTGDFLTREEAAKIAFEANQITKEIKTLFSEDLY